VFANRFRTGLEQFCASHPEFGQSTVSIGLAEASRDGSSVPALIAAADAALYKAKGAGRNLVRVAGSS
jgi:diguanylate cyclase (GGDEF)-like protein